MSRKILIVDDEAALIQIVRTQLTADGFEVVIAYDGRSGYEAAVAHRPDLIVTDVNMPDVTGYELTRQIRQNPDLRMIPIIILTSMASLGSMQAGFDAGADDYLAKPYRYPELKMRIEANLRRSDALRDAARSFSTGQVIAVFSLRGGSGCSSIATNLAVGFATMWHVSPLLIDLALPIGVADMMLNLQTPHNLGEIVQTPIESMDREYLLSCLVQHDSGVRLLGGFRRPQDAELLSDGTVSYILEHARAIAPFTIVDTAHNFTAPVLAALDAADEILIPITPDINSVRLTLAALKTFNELGYKADKMHVIVNWTFSQAGLRTDKVEQYLKHPVHLVIPHTPAAWSHAINTGAPAILADPETPLVKMLEDLTWRLSSDLGYEEIPNPATPMYERVAARQRVLKG